MLGELRDQISKLTCAFTMDSQEDDEDTTGEPDESGLNGTDVSKSTLRL